MQVEFTTRPFLLSHGTEPRGTGSWAFEFEDSSEPWFAPRLLTLTAAKKAARAEAQRRAGQTGISTLVKILP